MMYCTQCGAELPVKAKFCTQCGARVQGVFESGDTPGCADSPTVVASVERDVADADADASMLTTSKADAPSVENGRLADSEGSASPLQSAVKTARARSRRKIPLIVLVALALALATSVAYAAYCVYTNFFAESQPQSEEVASAEEGSQDSAASEEATSVEEEFEIPAAYDEVVHQYREVVHISSQLKPGYNTGFGWPLDGRRYVNGGVTSVIVEQYDRLGYSYLDLNNDSVPELLVGYGENVLDIWTYQEGELVHVAAPSERDRLRLSDDNVLVSSGSGSAWSGVLRAIRMKSAPLVQNSTPVYNDSNFTIVESAEWDRADRVEGWGHSDSESEDIVLTRTHADGTVEHFMDPDFDALQDEFSQAYPSRTDIEWQPLFEEGWDEAPVVQYGTVKQ